MNQKQLFEQVDAILWEDWDPIGVNDYNGPTDEYRGYVPSIVNLLNERADQFKLTRLLHQHANVNMGLSTQIEDHEPTASKLLELLK